MSNKIGRFEILSELTHSEIGSVYKATDTESGQTVALKTVRLEALGEPAAALVKNIQDEAQACKVLNSHNITTLNSAEEVEGNLCASMEYVQGNSVATMLARKEGFSIWDLQDVARQTCQGLDHAHVHKVVHYSLEPAKIMVQWDGIVKILSFGVSGMGSYAAQAAGKAPEVLHYMSPEQLRGEPVDARSNLFTLGAILYEMVTERKAFNGEDADQVRQSILEMTPVSVDQINRKIHPALSAVIMKALAKTPEERYQSGQELVVDLEKCKESANKGPAAKPVVGAKPVAAKPVAAAAEQKPAPRANIPAARPPQPVVTPQAAAPEATAEAPQAFKAAAAAAGWTGNGGASATRTPKLDPTEQFISSCIKASVDVLTGEGHSAEQATMSTATAEPEVKAPKIFDPMMDQNRKTGDSHGRSFSEIDELPPLKEVYVAPTPVKAPEPEPDMADPIRAAVFNRSTKPEKPRVQPREVAKKAVTEIGKTPPKLFLYSITAALGVMVMIIAGIAWHIHSGDSDDDSVPVPAAATTATQTNTSQASANQTSANQASNQNNASQNAAQQASQPAQAETPTQPPVDVTPEPQPAQAPVSVVPKYSKNKKKDKRPAPVAAPSIVAGQLNVDSSPQGAQIEIDGQSNGRWVTPYNVAGLTPGQHTVTLSKAGYATDTRTIAVSSGGRSAVVVQLGQLGASVSLSSDPAGAEIWMDGKNTGRVTPSQLSVEKAGNHAFVFKKQGYLDETASANLQVGQTFHLAPAMRALGTTDDIKIGGKFKKMFGGADTAGMGTVSIKTQPKGAQIAVNNRILDKPSPVDFFLNPGNYEVDITMSGFKSIHKVITVDKNGKSVIEENLDRQ